MSHILQHRVFYGAKAMEAVSVRLGFGTFEVGENWQCRDCVGSDSDLCEYCMASWIDELGHLNYSDKYERKVTTKSGIAMLVMGIVALMVNASMGLWPGGELMASISNLFKSGLPSFLLQRGPWTFYNNLFPVLLWLSSAVVFWGSISVAMFLLAMSPDSSRHWKDTTPSSYVGTFGQFIISLLLLIMDGLSMVDYWLIIWPVMTGVGICLPLFFMRKAKEPEIMDKLDAEEKQS